MFKDPPQLLQPTSDSFLAAIVASSNDAIISKDLSGVITSWNPAAERLFGYTASEAIGRSILMIFPPDRVYEESQILQRILNGEPVEHFDTVRKHRSGALIDISLNVSAIRAPDGRIIGISKIARDITEQKQSENELRRAQIKLESHALELEQTVAERTARLQEMVGELEAFSYSLSHDLRAPLRAIQGFTEIVLTDHGHKIPEAADYLRRVINAAARMDHLIRDVLAFSRVSRQDIAIEPVDVGAVVADILRDRPELAANADVDVASPLLPVLGHAASLTQCLTNLLDNAVKFVPEGGRAKVRVWTERHGGWVRAAVRDNGIGIDPDNQKRLFTLFQRLATTRRYEGTGMGLAIVRKAAERMGGRVGVESKPGEGSTFWVELRALDESAER